MKVKSIIFAFPILLLSCGQTSDSKSTTTVGNTQKNNNKSGILFEKYCNERFDYCVDFPKELIFPQPESYNGDGRVFKNKQGEDILTVFGRNNSDPDGGNISLEQQYEDDSRDILNEYKGKQVVTYQKLGNNFFVLSGYRNGKIFYQKTILKSDAFAYAILEYSEDESDVYKPIAENILKSFK